MARKSLQKPEVSSGFAQRELDKAEAQFDKFESDLKKLQQEDVTAAPLQERVQQNPVSTREIQKTNEIWLKPKRSLRAVNPKTGEMEKFNEKFRKHWEFSKEYVKFTATNNEIIGETIDLWTKPFGGVPAEEWEVPCNKPVMGPRYLAEQLKNAKYHVFSMENKALGSDQMGQYYGSMVAKNTVQRLDATPIVESKSIFMGASNF